MKTKCRICGKDFNDESYDFLIEQGVKDIPIRVICNECVDKKWKQWRKDV